MICKKIYDWQQLKQEFIKYNRDYFSDKEYQAIFEYEDNDEEPYILDVIALCCSLTSSTWEELHSDLFLNEIIPKEELIQQLENRTDILYYDDNRVLYFNY